jgi:hypothetical protein
MLNSKKLKLINKFAICSCIALSLTACEKDTQDLIVADANETTKVDSQSRIAAFPSGTHPKLNSTNSTWNASTGVFTITANVSFPNNDEDITGFHWRVPTVIKKVAIANNVTVTGGFKVDHTMEISGNNPNTSRIFGTNLLDWAEGRIPDSEKPDNGAINEIGTTAAFTITLRNLKIENSRTYAVTFRGDRKVIASRIYILNSRAKTQVDYSSNSDGFVMGRGSVIDECYIDTWDDAFKLFFTNQTIKNTTIVHNRNGHPFALGYNTVERVDALLSNIKVKNGGLGNTTATDANQPAFGGVNDTNSCDAHITLDNVSLPDYTNVVTKNGTSTRVPISLVRFDSPNGKVVFYGLTNKANDFSAKAQLGLRAPAGAIAKTQSVCTNSTTQVNIGTNYTCGTATGASWKD